MNKVYTIVAVATKQFSTEMALRVGHVLANNQDEALGKAYKACFDDLPITDGYIHQQAFVSEVEFALMQQVVHNQEL